MTTGSLCLTEILKSWKSCSSKRQASQTADSTSASAVALPYFSSRRWSSEPALTPMRIETPASLAPRAISLDLVVELADVARVDADRGAAGVDRGVDVLRLEVDVGDDRDLRLARDRRQRVGVVLGRAGHAHDVAAGGRELGDLLQRRVDVGGRRRRHRLHGDGRVAADRDLADLDLAVCPAGREDGRGRGGIPSETASSARAGLRSWRSGPSARDRLARRMPIAAARWTPHRLRTQPTAGGRRSAAEVDRA